MIKYFVFALLFIVVNIVQSSHYRGSMVSWRIVNTTSTSVTVELLQRHVWHYYTAFCNDTQIAAGNQLIGSGNLMCAFSCPVNVTFLASVAVPCIAYNIPENFTSGEGRTQIKLPANSSLTAVFNGAGWFVLALGGGNWSMSVQINTFLRTNGKFNQAPIITMLPIIRLRRNVTYNIRINVADNDFDPYKCFWSVNISECGGVCMKVPNTTVLNTTSCMLKFTGPQVGYYAIALTVVDYETTTSTTQLSRVPIQFLFKIWDSNNTCSLPPIYLGDVPADECIYIEPGQVRLTRILIKVRCPNATLDNIIGSYPSGFIRSPIYLDPYDSSINVFMINYTARVEQIGQNLFCFAGVDSIGNQADTTCLRFTVQQGTSSMNTLYLANATRFPMGTVNKTQSIWTLIYPNVTTFTRPNVDAYIRFKYSSSRIDFFTINVAKDFDVDYQLNKLVITTNVIFTPGVNFYVSLDPGVFLPASTCFRDSMGITDPLFWPFDIPSEPSTTPTTLPTTTTTISTTLRSRTSPVIRTISSTPLSTVNSVKSTMLSTEKIEYSANTQRLPSVNKSFPIGGIVAIIIGIFFLIVISTKIKSVFRYFLQFFRKSSKPQESNNLTDPVRQYRIVSRRRVRKSKNYEVSSDDGSQLRLYPPNAMTTIVSDQLVEIQC